MGQYVQSISKRHYTYQNIRHAYWPHHNGSSRQTTITQILTAHGEPPRHAIESCTGSKKGTSVPSPGIHPSTLQESSRRHPQITTVCYWHPTNNKRVESTQNTSTTTTQFYMIKPRRIFQNQGTLQRSLTIIQTCLTRWKLMHHYHKGGECA